jgi:hypothetical protein
VLKSRTRFLKVVVVIGISFTPAHAERKRAAKGEQLRTAGRKRQLGNGSESARNPGSSWSCRATDKPRQLPFPRPSGSSPCSMLPFRHAAGLYR